MSIIHDALKKAQKTNASSQLPSSVEQRPSSKKFILLYAGVALLGALCAKLFFVYALPLFLKKPEKPRLASQAKREPLPIKTVAPSSSLPQSNALVLPEIIKKVSQKADTSLGPESGITLNGVFFSEDEGYALINNQITQEGDVVAGAKVMKITVDEVELEIDGRLVKIYTYSK
jgi:hypothetical protein